LSVAYCRRSPVAFALISESFCEERRRIAKVPRVGRHQRYDHASSRSALLPTDELVSASARPAQLADNLDPFFATQYALAPVVLHQGIDQPLVVGNQLRFNAEAPRIKAQLIEDFGDGVVLFRRAPK
jgi:hypothetical protein